MRHPSVLAATNQYPLGQNPNIFAALESLEKYSAPPAFQELWMAHRDPRIRTILQSMHKCGESGITIPNVGIVISSGVQRRVSTDVRTGATVNALTNAFKLVADKGSGRTDCCTSLWQAISGPLDRLEESA